MSLTPRLDILPPAQRALWSSLRPLAALGFVLYGGTAIALRLGHRNSVDFDFFNARPLDRPAVRAACTVLAQSTVVQDEVDALGVLVPVGAEHVRLSFYGSIGFGRVGTPDTTDDGVLSVASLDDLLATKLKTILQRAEAKDYRDIAAMLRAGVDLPLALAAARLLFAPTFQPSESLRALVYFGDGDLGSLDADDKATLVNAARAVGDLPELERRSSSLGADQ